MTPVCSGRGCVMSIFSSIAKLLGKQSISNEEVLQVLRNHENRISDIEDRLEEMVAKLESRYNELSKKGQAAKNKATKDLEQLRSELDSLIGAVDVVISGELAAGRRTEIKKLMKTAKGSRTRIQKVIESRVN